MGKIINVGNWLPAMQRKASDVVLQGELKKLREKLASRGDCRDEVKLVKEIEILVTNSSKIWDSKPLSHNHKPDRKK